MRQDYIQRLNRDDILIEVRNERDNQDARFGSHPRHDGRYVGDFVRFIQAYAGFAGVKFDMNDVAAARERLIQTAALAVSAIEMIDKASGG